MKDDSEFIFVVIRGDLEVSERKLLAALGGGDLRAATEDEIRSTGAEPGYASPVGLRVRTTGAEGVTVIVDQSVEQGANFVVGANEAGYHLTGVNYPRDFSATLMADLAEVVDGAICASCSSGVLHIESVFELVWQYSKPEIDATYLDETGRPGAVALGWYGMHIDRIMGAIIEAHHDDYGIVWPRRVAPFDVHIVTLGKEPEYHEQGRELYSALQDAGLAVLLDDRDERPGVKFADADLIGVPLRLTISKRASERGAIEAKWRHLQERFDVPLADPVDEIVRLVRGGSKSV